MVDCRLPDRDVTDIMCRGGHYLQAIGASLMAKKLAAKKSSSSKDDRTGFNIRCTPAWREWVEAGAEYCRTDSAKLVDAALVDYLKARGFDQLAPKR
jgi:hypothetical protein